MDTYTLIYSETKKQLLAIIIVPLLISAVYIISLQIFEFKGELAFVVSIIAFFLALIFIMIWVMKSVVNLTAKVSITGKVIKITLDKTNPLYTKKYLEIKVDNISSITEDVNPKNGYKKYFSITTKLPAKTILLMQPRKMEEETILAFSGLLNGCINSYNDEPETISSGKIKQGSFFDAKWARVLTYFVYAALVTVTVAAVAGTDLKWYKVLQMWAISLSWLIAYHTGRSRKKLNNH